ncbi:MULTISPECIES: VanZ family protein [Streptococcus]|uniref:VanZ family protein n=1 Tax=Streptococcus caledonicus TaxID=2614158 RepID=A0ABW0UI28_9STRE|nr:VanZ family protein [Streptococcus sp. S784/96/1]
MTNRKFTKSIFILYLILLTWEILLKFETDLSYVSFFYGPRIVNCIPFAQLLVVNGEIVFTELLFNVIAFTPFGSCFPLIWKEFGIWKVIGLGFMMSLSYEMLQYILTIGMADVTDLLMNTLGVVVGIGILILMRKCFPNHVQLVVNCTGLLFDCLVLFLFIMLFFLTS